MSNNNEASRPKIEVRSIDYVPRHERHGKVWHQAPFWFTGNFVLTTMVTGFTGPALGLGGAVLDPGDRPRRLLRHLLHGLPCQPGPAHGLAADDPVACPVRPARGHRAVRRGGLRLYRFQRVQRDPRHRRDQHRAAGTPRALVRPADRRGGVARHRRPRPAAYRAALADLRDDRGVRRPHRQCAAQPRSGRGAGRYAGVLLERVPGPTVGRRRLPDQLCGLRLRLLPLPAARNADPQGDLLDLPGRRRFGALADVAGRIPGLGIAGAGRHRQRARGGQPAVSRLRHLHRADRRPGPGGDHGGQLLWRHAHQPQRHRCLPQGHSDPQPARHRDRRDRPGGIRRGPVDPGKLPGQLQHLRPADAVLPGALDRGQPGGLLLRAQRSLRDQRNLQSRRHLRSLGPTGVERLPGRVAGDGPVHVPELLQRSLRRGAGRRRRRLRGRPAGGRRGLCLHVPGPGPGGGTTARHPRRAPAGRGGGA